MSLPATCSFWLFDASALTQPEIERLRQAGATRWLYDHIPDEQARTVGPALAERHPIVDELAAGLQADEARAWAVTQLDTHADLPAVEKHLRRLCHLHTQDGQRFYLRYADSRCLVALWSVLSDAQRLALAGPVQRWAYTDRRGQPQAMEPGRSTSPDGHPPRPLPLRLQNAQLDGLLQATWPDQLLHTVLDSRPELGQSLSAWRRHTMAQHTCDWLVARREERYPVQQAMLRLVLSDAPPHSDEAAWTALLEAGYGDCLRATGHGHATNEAAA